MSTPDRTMELFERILHCQEESRKKLEEHRKELAALVAQGNSQAAPSCARASDGAAMDAPHQSVVECRQNDHRLLEAHEWYAAVREYFRCLCVVQYRMDSYHITFSHVMEGKVGNTVSTTLQNIIDKLREAFTNGREDVHVNFNNVADLITVPACIQMLKLGIHNKSSRKSAKLGGPGWGSHS
eukprot:m.17141 g.17141  ORF g.17141 m.17141 type:complete len:183 (+) comp3211_c1_seq1:1-549(+)